MARPFTFKFCSATKMSGQVQTFMRGEAPKKLLQRVFGLQKVKEHREIPMGFTTLGRPGSRRECPRSAPGCATLLERIG
jgi:hypothetical protein